MAAFGGLVAAERSEGFGHDGVGIVAGCPGVGLGKAGCVGGIERDAAEHRHQPAAVGDPEAHAVDIHEIEAVAAGEAFDEDVTRREVAVEDACAVEAYHVGSEGFDEGVGIGHLAPVAYVGKREIFTYIIRVEEFEAVVTFAPGYGLRCKEACR